MYPSPRKILIIKAVSNMKHRYVLVNDELCSFYVCCNLILFLAYEHAIRHLKLPEITSYPESKRTVS